MKRYYECHVTMLAVANSHEYHDAAGIEKAVEFVGWSFSAIDGDPVLGEGVKCYATKHFNIDRCILAFVVAEVEDVAAQFAAHGCNVQRKKVEIVEYDAIKGRDF